MPATTPRRLRLRDRLSRLTHAQACRLLGPRGASLLRRGGERETLLHRTRLDDERFQLDLLDARVTLSASDATPQSLHAACSDCDRPCEHVGAALALILEEKLALGLAAPPPERAPIESLDEEELVRRALEEREERARTERMTLRATRARVLWSDYTITNAASGKTYRLALRGPERGQSFCTCPDFRKNTLGTCKHVLHALAKLRRRFSEATFRRPHRRTRITVHLLYGERVELRLALPAELAAPAARAVAPFAGRAVDDLPRLLRCLAQLQRMGEEVVVHPDAEEYVEQRLMQARLQRLADELRTAPEGHPLRAELLRVPLLPYQLDGIAFAAGAGRAILADDMGLGKTIQAIGTAELLAREAGIERVLVVCPASVKAQWESEIARFSTRDARVVLGSAVQRAEQYAGDAFFTICNYEQVLRDLDAVERTRWDLIVLDEAQRIKNWEAKTSNVIKGLRSPFALALSGTPLENRLDELYSVVEFVDARRLAPDFRFKNRHRVVDERGRVLGYKNLAELRERLAPVLLRRTRAEVLDQLPARTTEVLRIPPTDEQSELHVAQMRTVSSIVSKRYISEMDLLRLQKALLMCRLAADGTALVDKEFPGHSSKLDELARILAELVAEEDRKVVLFSEWTTMLDLVEGILAPLGAAFVRLDGKVPQRCRKELVRRFQRDPDCRLFLTTNAGATGLNLQAADTVVNVDLPWNPALLEQRIARVHRMGQTRPVQVILFVTDDTLEERLLGTLAAKQELFQAVLDPDSELDEVEMTTGIDELKRRLEVLLGQKPDAPLDSSMQRDAAVAASLEERKLEVSRAGGRLLDAAFSFLGEVLPAPAPSPATDDLRARLHARLAECIEPDAAGRPTLRVTLPDEGALERLAGSLAALASSVPEPTGTRRDVLVPQPRKSSARSARGVQKP